MPSPTSVYGLGEVDADQRGPTKSEPGPPMTLGNAAAAQVRLIVWCEG
jgi:hypothetical protein